MTEKTILVIDTDAETSQRVKSILESEGYTVHNSAGRNDSISAAVKIKPSLIFINIAMRDTSGLEIAKGIHETESLKDVPIIIITPHGGTIEPRYTAMYGIVDFIKKAFSPEELISKTIDVVEMKSPDQPAVGEILPVQAHEQEAAALPPYEEPVFKKLQAEEIPATGIVPLQVAGKDAFSDISEKTTTEIIPEHQKEAAHEGLSEKPVPEYIREPEAVESEEPAGKSGSDIHSTEPEVALPDEEIYENISETVGSKPGRRNMTLVLFIILVITAAGAGFYFYTDSSGKPETLQPAPVKSPQPIIQEAQKVEPTREQQEAKKEIASAEKKKPFYSVQLGIFKKETNASALVKHFTKLNYKTFSYKTIGKNKKALYRVLIGSFDNKKEADALAKTIMSKENTKALIFRESGKPL
ncbi:MAG: response regulator [Thermodesulfovibrionales bacterium]